MPRCSAPPDSVLKHVDFPHGDPAEQLAPGRQSRHLWRYAPALGEADVERAPADVDCADLPLHLPRGSGRVAEIAVIPFAHLAGAPGRGEIRIALRGHGAGHENRGGQG